MPELPEVETTLQGIKPHLLHQTIAQVVVRHPKLRWSIPTDLNAHLAKQRIIALTRRGKYLLIQVGKGTLILHLGMSGRLRILSTPTQPQKHDHVDVVLQNKKVLRFTDPRRFGACLWTDNADDHFLLKNLGIEPFDKKFTGAYLFAKAQKRKVAIKTFIMDHHVVVGVGNIYATEALFSAGIHPKTLTHKISLLQFNRLVTAIKKILVQAIKKGGTTFRDFLDSDGKAGYFSLKLNVYGRAKLPCKKCKTPLQNIRLGQRSTVFCSNCQPLTRHLKLT